ncbi:WXG100 family type VII secretion target [Homoserinibacter sp. YIM 151385]|uniref:WXG100 family type VII secretion target n=1 Tax=Homoserinibacter sp. YIM 151385 TaxID=2985506 RepID=UPI0022F11EC0|nr:WXG100 family type VII secretion target [Homoserinibacter sp. YIM 151385]WBU38689.1 WXG100 family type VII secretion target [Homoserinibacter sp. YIM 151385]
MTFKANFGGIAAASADIAGGASKIETALNDMDRQLAPLQSDWTGAAAESYQAAKAQWTQALSDMKILLQEIGQQVGRDGEDFQAADNRNAQRFS